MASLIAVTATVLSCLSIAAGFTCKDWNATTLPSSSDFEGVLMRDKEMTSAVLGSRSRLERNLRNVVIYSYYHFLSLFLHLTTCVCLLSGSL